MRLASVKPGDIVLVDDGIPFHAEVLDRAPRELHVRPLAGHFNPKPVKPRDVKDHWRHANGRSGR